MVVPRAARPPHAFPRPGWIVLAAAPMKLDASGSTRASTAFATDRQSASIWRRPTPTWRTYLRHCDESIGGGLVKEPAPQLFPGVPGSTPHANWHRNGRRSECYVGRKLVTADLEGRREASVRTKPSI